MRLRKPIPYKARVALGVVSVLLICAFYVWLSHRQHVLNERDQTIPSLGQLWEGLHAVVTRNPTDHTIWLWSDGCATLKRLAAGLALSIGCSIILGVLMGCYPVIEAFFLPPLSFLAKIPPTAMLAVFFVTVGLGLELFVAMITFGTLPSLTQAIYNATKEDVPEELVWKSYTLGATQPEIIWNVVFKQILPAIIENIRLQVGPAMVFLIAAEMIGDSGFGFRIRLQMRLLDMRVVYIYLIFLGLFGFAFDHALRTLARVCCPWFYK